MPKKEELNKSLLRGTKISRVVVEGLYGYLNYRLPARKKALGSLSILYGENGTGKTTLLNLIYSLLCCERQPGVKSYLSKTQFKLLRVELSDGNVVAAEKTNADGSGNLRISIGPKGSSKEELEFIVADDGAIKGDANPHLDYLLQLLAELAVPLTYLPDTRAVKMAVPESVEHDVSFLRPLRADADLRNSWKRSEYERRRRGADQSHYFEITPIIRAVEFWMNRSVFAGTTVGAKSVNDHYLDMLKSMSSVSPKRTPATRQSFDKRMQRLKELALRAKGFQKYSLAPDVQEKEIRSMFRSLTSTTRPMIAPVFDSYLDSTETRLNALEHTRSRIDTLATLVNSLFNNKSLIINARSGLRIVGPGGNEIDPENLSSGERQLLSIFMHTLLAGEIGGVFLIDEPELSLNIRWQRRLLDSLLQFPSSNSLQVVLASHSMEILSKFRDKIVEL